MGVCVRVMLMNLSLGILARVEDMQGVRRKNDKKGVIGGKWMRSQRSGGN